MLEVDPRNLKDFESQICSCFYCIEEIIIRYIRDCADCDFHFIL